LKVNISHLILKTDNPINCQASKLRGHIGNKFIDHPLLHNHYSKEKYLYSYPLIQYKVINGQASIIGIEEGADLIKEISSDIKELKMDKHYIVEEKILHEKEFDINTSNKECHYQFISPWIGLNTKNYHTYVNMSSWKESKDFLNKILVGNILSMCKGLGIIVNRRLFVHSYFNQTKVQYKSVNMIGFTGEFKVKFKIPDYLGLGKGVSQGYGTVVQIW